jgi:hypothetical protein
VSSLKRLHVLGLGVPAAEELVEDPRLRHRVEGRVRDEAVDPAADEEALLPLHDGPLHAALAHGLRHVADECVLGLVVVVVRVEREEGKLRHAVGLLGRGRGLRC